MEFTYDFGNEGFYEYEPKMNEIKEYLLRTHSADELLTDAIDELLYDKLSKEDKDNLKNEWDFDGTYDSIDNNDEQVNYDMLVEFFLDDLIKSGIYDNEFKDYFEQAAYDEMKEIEAEKALRRDSYKW